MQENFLHFLSPVPSRIECNGKHFGFIDNEHEFELDLITKTNHIFISYIPISQENQSIPYTFKLNTDTAPSTTNEYIKIFNPASVWHINLIANDMLTLSAGMVNLFEYDENMKYDEALMAEDIEKYGLYTYEDFDEYVSIEVFNAFPFKYYKVAIGKGLYTYEQLLGLIQLYNDLGSVK